MSLRRRLSLSLLAYALSTSVFSMPCFAVNPATWVTGTIATTGNDVSWISPTAVDVGFPRYDYSYEITRADAFYNFLGEQSLDLLPQIGTDVMGSGFVGALPIELINDSLQDSTTGSSADIFMAIRADGFGELSVTNVSLGIIPILGQITRVELEADIMVTGIPGPTGDYNNDGTVEIGDYNQWASAFGAGGSNPADGSGNGFVDAADFTIWADHLGATVFPPGAVQSVSVPEPTAATLYVLGIFVLCLRRAG